MSDPCCSDLKPCMEALEGPAVMEALRYGRKNAKGQLVAYPEHLPKMRYCPWCGTKFKPLPPAAPEELEFEDV